MTQAEALNILKLGKNAYITGPAGSGKTHLLNQYIDYLKEHNVDVGITASTGIAATHMGGVTIHSWSGLGIRDTLSEFDLESMEEKQYLWKRFDRVKVLIIDEVSMLHHFRLDLVDRIIRQFKRSDLPFGGIQVVLCGDFFQLPPISRQGEQEAHFIYKAQSWKDAGFSICYLEEQFRQKDDATLTVLNAIRDNRVDEDIIEHLKSRYQKKPDVAVEPTRLYAHNIDVDAVNDRELAALAGQEWKFSMTSRGKDTTVASLKKSCLAPEVLRLKAGARVIFVKNDFEAGFVNGTLGVVESLDSTGPVVRLPSGRKITVEPLSWTVEEDGKVKAEVAQFPLRLAWAITVHKSQGMSLDAVEVDLSKSFERGMGYVALSRVRSLSGLNLLGFNAMALQVSEEVLEADYGLRRASQEAVGELYELSKKEKEEQQAAFLAKVASGKKKKSKVGSTYDETKEMIQLGSSIVDIAAAREVTKETVLSHIEKLIETEPDLDISYLRKELSPKLLDKILRAFEELVGENPELRLSPVKTKLGDKVSFADIRLGRLFYKGKSR